MPKEALAHLRKHHLVEGRAGNLYLAAPLAKTDDDKAKYIKNRDLMEIQKRHLIRDFLVREVEKRIIYLQKQTTPLSVGCYEGSGAISFV